jgi:hypothetical protein
MKTRENWFEDFSDYWLRPDAQNFEHPRHWNDHSSGTVVHGRVDLGISSLTEPACWFEYTRIQEELSSYQMSHAWVKEYYQVMEEQLGGIGIVRYPVGSSDQSSRPKASAVVSGRYEWEDMWINYLSLLDKRGGGSKEVQELASSHVIRH